MVIISIIRFHFDLISYSIIHLLRISMFVTSKIEESGERERARNNIKIVSHTLDKGHNLEDRQPSASHVASPLNLILIECN